MAASRDRLTLCTSCDQPMQIDVNAKSVSCRHCHARVITESARVTSYMAVRNFKVANHVHVTRKGLVFANIRADELKIEGRVTGNIVSLQGVHITKKASVEGDVRASSLIVDNGAVLVGDIRVGPDEMPELRKITEFGREPAEP